MERNHPTTPHIRAIMAPPHLCTAVNMDLHYLYQEPEIMNILPNLELIIVKEGIRLGTYYTKGR